MVPCSTWQLIRISAVSHDVLRHLVPITRQAVATTPSAAVKLARRAGYPVEIKPWGHDLPAEPAGCPVERGVGSDALVRKAFATAGRSTEAPP